METKYNEKLGIWEEAEPIPYYRPCLAKRMAAKFLWFLLGWLLKQSHNGDGK